MRPLVWMALFLLAPTIAAAALSTESGIGLSHAVSIAERRHGGHAIDVERDVRDGIEVFALELVRDGKRIKVVMDARDGRVVSAGTARVTWMTSWLPAWLKDVPPPTVRALAPILARIEQESHGRVRRVELEQEDGRYLYEIEVETAAGIADMHVDPLSGRRYAAAHD